MKKLLKIGIPILVAVLVLIIGAGLVLAKNDAPVLTGTSVSYDGGYPGCPQSSTCPCLGNGGEWEGCGGGGYCKGPGAGYGPGGWAGDNDANYQPPCHRYGR